MSSILIHHLSLGLFCIALILAAAQDMSEYKISNKIVLGLLVLLPVYLISAPTPDQWMFHLATGFIGFALGVFLFKAGIMGGGDVKLITACLFWIGLDGFLAFLIMMTLVGGAMALFLMSPLRHPAAFFCAHVGLTEMQNKILTNKIPYGVAICAGGLFSSYQILSGL